MPLKFLLKLAVALAVSAQIAAAAAATQEPADLQLVFTAAPHASSPAARPAQFPHETALHQSAAGSIIPLWSGSASGFGSSYPFTMVGASPETRQMQPVSTIPTVVVPLRFAFETSKGTVVLDPTAPDPGSCLPAGQTALSMTLRSPVFQPLSVLDLTRSDGQHVSLPQLGSGQYADLFQRANFYNFTRAGALNPGYHVTLAPTVAPTVTILVPNADALVSMGRQCATSASYKLPTGLIEVYSLDSFIQTRVIPALSKYITPRSFAVFLTYNVAEYWTNGSTNECCVLGDHNAYDNNGLLQTYAVADYESSGNYALASDVSILSREIMAWMNDPLVSNRTPAYWVNAGTANGCVEGLEVNLPFSSWIFGPPLGTVALHGFSFTLEEGAFHNWYFGASPSGSVNGWYSSFGSLTAPSIDWTICKT